MSNKASSHLFDLIKSLSKSEKRYFKLFAGRHTIGEENGYIRLFDFIDRMDDYQEDLVFMHFRGQAFLNKFSITKSRLYDNILRSLDAFHAASSPDAQIYRSIHNAEILFNKGLYSQCEKILRSAEKQAQKHECLNLLLEIKQKQKLLIESKLYANSTPKKIEELYADERQLIKDIDVNARLWKTKSLLFQEINLKGKLRSSDEIEKLNVILSGIQDLDLENGSAKNKHLFHHTKSAYYFAQNDLEKCYEHLQANIELVDSTKFIVSDQPNLLYSLLSNIVYVATRLKDFEKAQDYLSRLKAMAGGKNGKTNNLEIKYFSTIYSLELSLYSEKGDYNKGLELIPIIEEGYRLYDDKIPSLRKAYLDYQIAILFLSTGNYNDALGRLNLILNNADVSPKQEIYAFSQMLNLIVHVELENNRFLPYAYSSAKRFFKKYNSNTKFESLFLKVINEMIKVQNRFDLEDKLQKYLAQMEPLLEDKLESTAFEYFDFYSWIKSKIERKEYQEIRKNKLLNEAV
ncbi:MAG: hypothetical protein MK078_13815 [Crocinitomicaceae bacterium]|nr:hypothetical protein [Crocinitomicaceae bacterium]